MLRVKRFKKGKDPPAMIMPDWSAMAHPMLPALQLELRASSRARSIPWACPNCTARSFDVYKNRCVFDSLPRAQWPLQSPLKSSKGVQPKLWMSSELCVSRLHTAPPDLFSDSPLEAHQAQVPAPVDMALVRLQPCAGELPRFYLLQSAFLPEDE